MAINFSATQLTDALIPDWPAPAHVRALSTTRAGGVSDGPYRSLNLALHVGDDEMAVTENRRRLQMVCGLEQSPTWLSQVHGITVVDAKDDSAQPPQADAAFSSRQGVACVVMTADCLPVLLTDTAGTCVAAAHAGWRGLVDGVLEATVARLPVAPAQILAWLGPAIGPGAFEVGPEVRAAFIAKDAEAADAFIAGQSGRWMCDLYMLAKLRLAAMGVTQIYGGGLCTHSDATRFFSYRRDGVTGRMASLIWLTA